NFWSLNTDEAVVTGILRSNLNKDVEVFMPLNSQMKDVDLALVNVKSKKTLTIQIKGSKAYKPTKSEINKHGQGSNTFISVKKEAIKNSTADYFIFLLHIIEQFDKDENGRLYIEPYTVIIPTKELINKLENYKNVSSSGAYRFYFWVNPRKSEVFEWRDLKIQDQYGYYNEFLDEKGFEKLNNNLK
ncbi:MAG: hypothetical protein NTX85_02835, partial [Candidatus Nomurabacteria bacterium]|nr:hypothetical protein [Candidatus Nomurabacteria bacterium]